MKVKLFDEKAGFMRTELDDKINKFVKDKKVIDIKYSVSITEIDYLKSALVIYEDQK